MATHATCRFQVTGWDEKPYSEIEGLPKLTRASVTQSYSGEIEGEGSVEYLMVYLDDGTASFVSLERVTGRLGERSGSFMLQGSGTDDGTAARLTSSVVPGSGTGELRGLRGQARFVAARHENQVEVSFEYEFNES